MIENRKYWMIPKNLVGTIVIIFMLTALGGLIYTIINIPKQMRMGIYPRIEELDIRITETEKKIYAINNPRWKIWKSHKGVK